MRSLQKACSLVALSSLLALTSAPRAGATFGQDEAFQIEEISAFTLRAEELKIGPTAVRYGILGQLQLGTGFALNIFGALNADLKWRIYDGGAIAVGVSGGVVHYDPDALGVEQTDFTVTAIPLELVATLVADDSVQVHLRANALLAKPERQAPDSVLRIQRYLGPVGKLAAEVGLEWRLSSHFALLVDYAVPAVMHDRALLYAAEDPDDVVAMMSVTSSLLGTFETFNFRVGVGFGPSVLGRQGVFPVLDLYWRIF